MSSFRPVSLPVVFARFFSSFPPSGGLPVCRWWVVARGVPVACSWLVRDGSVRKASPKKTLLSDSNVHSEEAKYAEGVEKPGWVGVGPGQVRVSAHNYTQVPIYIAQKILY